MDARGDWPTAPRWALLGGTAAVAGPSSSAVVVAWLRATRTNARRRRLDARLPPRALPSEEARCVHLLSPKYYLSLDTISPPPYLCASLTLAWPRFGALAFAKQAGSRSCSPSATLVAPLARDRQSTAQASIARNSGMHRASLAAAQQRRAGAASAAPSSSRAFAPRRPVLAARALGPRGRGLVYGGKVFIDPVEVRHHRMWDRVLVGCLERCCRRRRRRR
jgi:hypothetical protein